MASISGGLGPLPPSPGKGAAPVAAAGEPNLAPAPNHPDRFDPGTAKFPAVQILGADELTPAAREKLVATAERAVAFFQEHFGSASRPVKLDVRSGGAQSKGLRTGYNPETDTVCFPRLKHVKNAGLDSVDIINHEIFHALMFQSYPQFGAEAPAKRMHEALADYFAYQLNPDERFGEDYLVDKEQLRFYRNSLAVSLTCGPHAQGNAITSLLLKNGIEPQQIRQFLDQGDFSLAGLAAMSPGMKADLALDASFSLAEQAAPYPLSSTRRYYIRDDEPLQLAFSPNEDLKKAHPNLRVEWSTLEGLPSQHYVISSQGQERYVVARKPDAPMEKVVAYLYDADQVVGARPFYFAPETAEEAAELEGEGSW